MSQLTAPVAGNPGEFAISGASDHTGWFPLDNTIEDVGYNITGTWAGTIALQVSNQNTFTKTRFSTVVSYTGNQSPLNLPREVGRYFRFIFTSYSSGTAYIGLSKGRDSNGALFDIVAQGERSGGA